MSSDVLVFGLALAYIALSVLWWKSVARRTRKNRNVVPNADAVTTWQQACADIGRERNALKRELAQARLAFAQWRLSAYRPCVGPEDGHAFMHAYERHFDEAFPRGASMSEAEARRQHPSSGVGA